LLEVLSNEIFKVSSLSEYEYVKIMASVEASYEAGFNCTKCVASLKKRKANAYAKQKAKGCFDFESKKFILGDPFKEKAVKFEGCVGNYTSLSVNYFADLFFNSEKGVLPFKGTLGEQPAKIIEVFQVLEKRIGIKKTEQEEQRDKRGR